MRAAFQYNRVPLILTIASLLDGLRFPGFKSAGEFDCTGTLRLAAGWAKRHSSIEETQDVLTGERHPLEISPRNCIATGGYV